MIELPYICFECGYKMVNRYNLWSCIKCGNDMHIDTDAVRTMIADLQARVLPSNIPCIDCGQEVVEFSVPNDLWNKVMRPDGHETDKEYLCFVCWNKHLIQYMTNLEFRVLSDEVLDNLITMCGYFVASDYRDGEMNGLAAQSLSALRKARGK